MSPAASLCVRAQLDEKPERRPTARLASSNARIASRSSAVASPCVARSPIATRRIVEWPTRKPAFGASVPSMRSRYSPKRPPVPRHALGERGERHALDPGQHAHEVVAVLGPERRDREAAVAADHGRHAVQRRRRQRRVPEHLRVVVRVDVDEAGRDDLARRRRSCASAVSSMSPIAVIRPLLMPTSAIRPGAPVPSTTVPPRMIRSSMTPLLSSRHG